MLIIFFFLKSLKLIQSEFIKKEIKNENWFGKNWKYKKGKIIEQIYKENKKIKWKYRQKF